MLFRELLDRANEETKIILKKYMVFVSDNSIVDENPIHRDAFKIFGDAKQLAFEYLLYTAFIYDSELAHILNNCEYGNIKVPFSKHVQKTIENGYIKYTSAAFELAFDYEYQAASILKAYANLNGPICIERIIFNFIKDYGRKCFKYFNINDCSLLEIEALADTKEKRMKKLSKISEKPIETSMGENLTFKNYLTNPLIGREKEFRNMCALLMDDEKSLIIHGLPGVGKTTLINGLAYKIQNGLAPASLQDRQIIEVSASELISGCPYVGMMEEKVLNFINSLLNENVILYIDEIHTLMGLGQSDKSTNDVSNILKPYLGDGRIKIVGATTTEEYNLILENGAFARRFNGLEIPVLNDKEVLIILKSLITKYQETKKLGFKYSLDIQNNLLELILQYTNKKHQNYFYDKQLFNPDFALTILRNGYNYAQVDSKNALDVESLIEGFKAIDFISDTYKKEFEERALSLVRKQRLDKNIVDIKELIPNHFC